MARVRFFQLGQEAAAFLCGILMILGEGQGEGFPQPAAGLIRAGAAHSGLAQEETGHQPIGASGGTFFEVLEGFSDLILLKESLTEAEPKQKVAGLGGDAGTESFRTHEGGISRKGSWEETLRGRTVAGRECGSNNPPKPRSKPQWR